LRFVELLTSCGLAGIVLFSMAAMATAPDIRIVAGHVAGVVSPKGTGLALKQ